MVVGATIGAADDLMRNEEEFWVMNLLEFDTSCLTMTLKSSFQTQ